MTRERERAFDELHLQILNTAPDAMLVVTKTAEIILLNARAASMLGYSPEELLGKSLGILLPDSCRANVLLVFEYAEPRPIEGRVEVKAVKKDGAEFPIEVGLSPFEHRGETLITLSVRDISDRKNLEALNQLATNRLERTLENISEPVVLFDANERAVLCNQGYHQLAQSLNMGNPIGRTREELLAKILDKIDFVSEADRGRFYREREIEWREPTAIRNVRYKDGRFFRVVSQKTNDGGVVQTMRDLTEDTRREEALRIAHKQADEANQAKSEFLSSMSHELRTPLNAILGFAQLLQRDKKEPLSKRHLDRVDHILNGGEHLLRLINDILDLSRIEARTISVSPEAVEVGELVEVVRRTLEPMALRAGVSLSVAEIPAVPAVLADRTRLAQILMNFGSNAIKYNREGGSVTIVVSKPSATHVRMTVIDDGIGIPKNKLDKMFQPFQRAGQETGPIEGTGIGLVITKRLAELMKGSVGFESEAGVGSEFWVDVPIHLEDSQPPSPRTLARPAALLDGKSRSILYVEDNPANIGFMQDLLEGFEHVALTLAPTAEIGLELARSKRPDIIIMDINLPGLNGIQALRELAKYDETKHTPVIALTAAASERDERRGIEAGFFRYLTKPVKVDELESALARAFEEVNRMKLAT